MISETRCIWSRHLLLDREESFSDLAFSLLTRAGPLQPILMRPRLAVVFSSCPPLARQTTLPRGIGRQPSQEQTPTHRVLQ
jgi:hypothetical protein